MSKSHDYRSLVSERKLCRCCGALTNPSDDCLREFDTNHLGPWSVWQGDLDAKLMVVGQDWGGSITFLRQGGRDSESPTNKNLRTLLESVGFYDLRPPQHPTVGRKGIFLTNALLCIKQGRDNGYVPARYYRNCREKFLRPTIELVQPDVVVSLGVQAYRSTMLAFSLSPKRTLAEAVESDGTTQLPNGTLLVPVFHCGGLGLRNRPMPQQLKDWARVRAALAR